MTILFQRAEAAANESRERDRLREALILSIQGERFNYQHQGGWSEKIWGRVRQVAELRPGNDLRDQAAAALRGLDVRRLHGFDFDACALAFDPSGKRLLISRPGEETRGKNGGPIRRAAGKVQVWDGSIDEPRTLSQPGSGEVFAFRRDGTALLLTAPEADPSALVLWDVFAEKQLRRFRFPDEGKARDILAYAATPDAALVTAAAASSDGKPGVVAVWEGPSGRLVYSVAAAATAVALAPDGSLLATGNRDGKITVRTLPGGDEVAVFSAGATAIQTLAFGRDPLRPVAVREPAHRWLLAAGNAGSRVTVWDVAARALLSYCLGSVGGVNKVRFSPDGVTLASVGRGPAKLWDVQTGHLFLDISVKNSMTDVVFSPDGARMAVAAVRVFGPGGVDVWQLEDGRGLRTLRGLVAAATKQCFSPDGQLLAALADDWHVAVWERATGRLRFVFEAPKGYFSDNAALAFNADGSRLAFAAGTEAVLWDVADGRTVRHWDLPPGFQDRLAFHPSGKLLLARVETQGGKVVPFHPNHPRDHPRVFRLRDLLGEEPRRPFKEIPDFKWHVFHSALAADGSILAVDGVTGPQFEGRAVKVFDGPTGALLWSRPLDCKYDNSGLRLDTTGRLVVLWTGSEAPVTILEARTEKHVAALPRAYNEYGPGARFMAEYQTEPPWGVTLVRRSDREPLVTLGLNVYAYGAQFDGDGRHLAWGNRDGTVILADLEEVHRRLAEFKLEW